MGRKAICLSHSVDSVAALSVSELMERLEGLISDMDIKKSGELRKKRYLFKIYHFI